MSESAAIVSPQDKVNNAKDIVRDLQKSGVEVLGKFAGGGFVDGRIGLGN